MPLNNDSTKDKKPITNPFVVEVESPEEAKQPAEVKKPVQPTVKTTPLVEKPKEVVRPSEVKTPAVKPSVPVQKKTPQLPDKLKLEARQAKPQWGMFLAGVAVTLLLAAAGVRVWWVQNGRLALPTPIPAAGTTAGEPAATLQPTTPEPTPTPATLERGVITVTVLNASGVKGKANEVANQIKDLGYIKGTVGNTTTQTGSTLRFSSDLASRSATINDDLSTVVPGLRNDNTVVKGTGTVEVRLGK